MAATPEELERRLDAREWLLVGEVATLLDVDRTTIHRMLTAAPPRFRYRVRTGGGYRELHPDDVQRELQNRRTIHGGSTE